MSETPVSPLTPVDITRAARDLIRGLDRAVLASALPVSPPETAPWPYASLVLVAADHDLSPLLLISNLAEHTRAIARDDRVSLLFDGTAGLAQPLTGPRLSVLGRAAPRPDARLKARYLARHPDAALYASFADFQLYRVAIERAHLVGGFGKIHWIAAADLLSTPPPAALVEAEAGIVAHMNDDHADALDLYATRLLGQTGAGWRMTGIDSEGLDLRREGLVRRLPFDRPVGTAEEARKALVSLALQARATR
jgi:putative heme iron utilization protein